MKIYIGNLNHEVSEDELREEFAPFGKGSEGQAAINGLNGKTLKERTLTVNAARPRNDNRGGRSFGDRKGGGFGGGRRGRY